jgi:hypothetical protein
MEGQESWRSPEHCALLLMALPVITGSTVTFLERLDQFLGLSGKESKHISCTCSKEQE